MISRYSGGINILKKHSHYKTKNDRQASFLNAEYVGELASKQVKSEGIKGVSREWEITRKLGGGESRHGSYGGPKDNFLSQELRTLGSLTIALRGEE